MAMFGTSGIRGRVGEDVTAATALSLGRALAAEGADRVVVGRDARESGRALADAVSAGARESGCDVERLGRVATPTLARAVGWRAADAGVAVTGSHNPPTDNGLKLWTPTGRAFGPERRRAIAGRIRAAAWDLAPATAHGVEERVGGVTGRHRRRLVDRHAETSLAVVVDVGNGAGRVTADALADLGCDVTTLNGQPDGRFPGRESEPTAESLRDLGRTVAATDADLGVAHDGDADRTMAVDASGSFVPGDVLFAAFARETVGEGDRVAAPVNASLLVDDVVEAAGGRVERTEVGDVHVAAAASAPDVVLGGEPSGTWIWPSETLCPDGPFAACRLVEFVDRAGSVAALLEGIDPYPIRRGAVETAANGATVRRVRDRVLADHAEVDTADGVRVDLGDAWFLVRASGTEPLVRVTAEARTAARAEAVYADAREMVADAAPA
jgi:phosphoglucosamine mutase